MIINQFVGATEDFKKPGFLEKPGFWWANASNNRKFNLGMGQSIRTETFLFFNKIYRPNAVAPTKLKNTINEALSPTHNPSATSAYNTAANQFFSPTNNPIINYLKCVLQSNQCRAIRGEAIMTQAMAKPKLMTLEEFLNWYPDGRGLFELHNGVVIEIQPTGTHELVAGFLAIKFGIQTESLGLPYSIPRQCIVKPIDSDISGFIPDIAVLDNKENPPQPPFERGEVNEPMWKKRSTITKGETIPLIVEVVSTNWQDDYLMKFTEYEKLGIAEYWIVDYLGLGGRRYIGNPKQPTISVYQIVDGEYAVNLFRGSDRLESSIFPELNLTAEQVFEVGKS